MGLRRSNSARSGGISSVSSAGIPLYHMGGDRPQYAASAMSAPSLSPRTPVLRITGRNIHRRREEGMIIVPNGGTCTPLFFFLGNACAILYVLSLWWLYIFGHWKFILDLKCYLEWSCGQ